MNQQVWGGREAGFQFLLMWKPERSPEQSLGPWAPDTAALGSEDAPSQVQGGWGEEWQWGQRWGLGSSSRWESVT